MKMKNRLAGAGVDVEDGAVALLVDTILACELLCHLKHVGKKRAVFRNGVVQRRDVKTWADQQVNRSLRPDVLEREDLVVFINLLRRRLACDDPAK